MIDSTNPRSMADNIRHLAGASGSQASDISTLQTIVEAQGDAIEALQTFSTTEVNTGMKYGDSDIYRKVFHITDLPNNETKAYAHGIDNLGDVLRLDGVIQYATGFAGRPVTISATSILTYNATNIFIANTADLTGKTAIVILEYTKPAPASLTSPAPDDTRSIEPEEIPEDEYIEPEVREEAPEEEPVQEVKKTTRKKATN